MSAKKILFVIQKFESKPRLEDSAGYLEIARPLAASGKLKDYEFFHFGKDLHYYEKLLEDHVKNLSKKIDGQDVVIYGAGAHTEFFLDILQRLNIKAISDSEKSLWGKVCCGYTIIPPDDIPQYANHLVISTRAFEKTVFQQLSDKFNKNIDIHRLYTKSSKLTNSWQQDVCRQLETRLKDFQPDILLYSPSHPDERLPDQWFFDVKKKFPQTKIITVWWDYDESSENNAYIEFERVSLAYSDRVIELGNFTRLERMRNQVWPYHHHEHVEKIQFLSPPVDPDIFYPRQIEKKIDIAIFGSAVGQRVEWIRKLKSYYGERFLHVGWVYKNPTPLPIEEYARMLSETKIVINTQTYPFRTACKGKVKEALASGVFLLEEDNQETRAVVPEGRGVVYFSSFDDLVEKIKYFLNHDNEREAIAHSGLEWFKKKIFLEWHKEILNLENSKREVS